MNTLGARELRFVQGEGNMRDLFRYRMRQNFEICALIT